MWSSTLHIFAGRKVDLKRFTFRIGEVGEAAIEHGLSSRDELHHHGMPFDKCRIDRRQQTRQFH